MNWNVEIVDRIFIYVKSSTLFTLFYVVPQKSTGFLGCVFIVLVNFFSFNAEASKDGNSVVLELRMIQV